MSQWSLEQFGAYRKAMDLFDMVVADVEGLQRDPRCYRLVGQQVGSSDSICANIEEGHGRLSSIEYRRFLDIARGSARETRGRYQRMKHWLPADVINTRTRLLDEIIGILTSTIVRLGDRSHSKVREDASEYGSASPLSSPSSPLAPPSSPLAPRPSSPTKES